MLSKTKLTFSLTSFIVLIAFGLVCFAPSVMADGDAKKTHFDLTVKISAAESMIDVSHEGDDAKNIQIASGRDRTSRLLEGAEEDGAIDALAITLLVEFSHVVNLAQPAAPADPLVDIDTATKNEPKPSGGDFGEDDLYVAAYDKEGRSLGVLSLAEAASNLGTDTGSVATISQFRDAGGPGRQFLIRIDESLLIAAYVSRGGPFEIYSLVFFIPKGIPGDADLETKDATVTRGIRKYDRAHAISHFAPDAHQHLNDKSNEFQVDLVDDDEGDPEYSKIISSSTAARITADGGETGILGSGTPGVVSITRILARSGFRPIETGPFDVRIILTEEPRDGFTADMVNVENGTAGTPVKGLTYKGASLATEFAARTVGTGDTAVIIPEYTVPAQLSELTAEMLDYHIPGATPEDNPTPVNANDEDAPEGSFPEPTGRDNKFHEYSVMVMPNAGVNGDVVVSIKAFMDNVKPISNMYVPITREQRLATTLSGTGVTGALAVRNARVMNETITVRVNAGADTTSVKALATAAYKTRQEDVLDKVANEFLLGNKLVVPAGGYLVIVVDSGKAGIAGSDAKIKVKETNPATKDYNIFDPGDNLLPFPADDLDNFFRNGGTLNLGYADIPAATAVATGAKSQLHDDAKASAVKDDPDDGTKVVVNTEHDDYTGYNGATTNAYAKRALIINEIMWGLDGNDTTSQYIELHNPGTADVTIDSKEWVITVGSLPPGYAAIDTVSNNPASGYWTPPGNGGVTAASVDFPTVIDLVSMSRVAGGADGKAEASWAASMRPSANLSGRRVGTPGAKNKYVMPAAVVPPPTTPVTPAAPAATASDIMISEIMVASDDGRLPQWIELSNVSAAAVSLTGWSLEVENDADDDDVVGVSIELDLGDVEIGADQVALVVSKEAGRNSGVGTSDGDLRADRIINVQSQVSPDNARYSLISERAFTATLLPPRTGAVRTPGDAAGNLGGGWELPMSEEGRSSLIRSDKDADAGTDAADWILASDTMLDGAYRTTYYGHADDVGTPGFDAGGALPVELSGFNAARDRVTGAVVITWETQSELNNAGFFIKRSQQQKSKFVVVNPTMISGAGTTAEKQSYTYTDATADPNVIYFYQIEDVSLDGNRQTLTRAHRLKGHIGAAGKATTTWADLKSSRD